MIQRNSFICDLIVRKLQLHKANPKIVRGLKTGYCGTVHNCTLMYFLHTKEMNFKRSRRLKSGTWLAFYFTVKVQELRKKSHETKL